MYPGWLVIMTDDAVQIVDKKSATLNLPGETQVGCEADHSLICKFDSDEECELVVGTIAYDLDRALELGRML